MELKRRVNSKACTAIGCKAVEGLVEHDVAGKLVPLCPAHVVMAQGTAPVVEGSLVVRADYDVAQLGEEHRQAEEILVHLTTVEIASEADLAFWNDVLVQIKAKNKQLEGLKQGVMSPLNDAVKKIRAVFSRPQDGLSRVEAAIKAKIQQYFSRLDEERKRAAALIAQPQASSSQVEHALETLAVNQRPQVQGLIVSNVLDFEIIDVSKLPREYLVPNPVAIRTAISGGARDIPGVRIFEKMRVASRA